MTPTTTRLDKLTEVTHRNKSFLENQEWQMKEIKKGIAEADAGQFVDHSSIVKYWEKKRAHFKLSPPLLKKLT